MQGLGYTGVIVAEPLVWFIMVIPLIIRIFRMPVLHKTQEVNSIHNLKKNGMKKEKSKILHKIVDNNMNE